MRHAIKTLPKAPLYTIGVLFCVVLASSAMAQNANDAADHILNYSLPFELTHEKMEAFAATAVTIRETNKYWDIIIAGSESDTVAMENGRYAEEEILSSLNERKDTLSIDEYKEIFSASNRNQHLNRLVQAYMTVYESGRSVTPIQKQANQ